MSNVNFDNIAHMGSTLMHRQIAPNGHRPSIVRLRIDLHHLISIFLASKPIAELVDKEPEYATRDLLSYELEDAEISRLLLSAAITLRVLDDRERKDLDCFSLQCGTIIKKTHEPEVLKGLTIRDACNKIIHAIDVQFDRTCQFGTYQHLGSTFRLEGQYKGDTWRATINAYEFAREGLRAVRDL